MRQDGIHAMLPYDQCEPHVQKQRDFYARKPGAPFIQREFGYYCLDRWYSEGLDKDADLAEVFGYDQSATAALRGLGWCEAGFEPEFETVVLEDRGEYELEQDFAGRGVLYFKGRRNGFMPEYVTHPVRDEKSFMEKCAWRMDPNTPERQAKMDIYLPEMVAKAKRGYHVAQGIVGGYMYLRALIGPGELLTMFYDDPKLVHLCMRAWYELADSVIARHQQALTIDEVFIGEDICYNHGPLISPDMMKEFLFPYYQQLLDGVKRRNIDQSRHVYFQVDTDGNCRPVIDLYKTLGMDYMSPFEVASGCDVVAIGQQYPELIMSGGVDKRVLALGPRAIDEMVDRVFPAMRARGGYTPTSDHGVPEEVSLENYIHYRKRCKEFSV